MVAWKINPVLALSVIWSFVICCCHSAPQRFEVDGFGDREKELFYESDKILDFEEDWKELFRRERSLRAVEGQRVKHRQHLINFCHIPIFRVSSNREMVSFCDFSNCNMRFRHRTRKKTCRFCKKNACNFGYFS